MTTSIPKVIDDNRYAILIVVGVVGLYAIYALTKKAATDVTTAAQKAVNDAADAVSNVNQGTVYEGTGVVGTLGHAFDDLSGGALSTIGGALGGWLYDTFHPITDARAGSIPTSNQDSETSGSIQSSSARPYQNGNNAAYADAYDSSPPDPSYTGNALVGNPQVGLDDGEGDDSYSTYTTLGS